MNAKFYLGVDGGGSRCRVRIRAADGTLIGEAEGGLANVHQDRQDALANIRATIARAAPDSFDLGRTHAGFGLAGITDSHMADEIAAAAWPFASITVEDDAAIACLGAHLGADGGIIITGTGSAALCRIKGRTFHVGGRGFALGDGGSGAQLGLAALRAAMSALDGLGPDTALTEHVLERFGRDAGAMARWALKALPRDYAEFAPNVFAAAKAGDMLAARLIGDAAAELDALARRLMSFGATRLCLIGGLAEAMSGELAKDVRAALAPPRADPLEGALLLARRTEEA